MSNKRKPTHETLAVTWCPPAEGTAPQSLEQAIAEARAKREAFQREFSHVPHIREGEFTDFLHPLKV